MNFTPSAEHTAEALRHAFDQSFALPPPPPMEAFEDLITMSLGGNPYAVLLRDIAGMVAGSKVITVPAVAPYFLGIAGVRGEVVPVFGLAAMLGYPEDATPPRWMLLCGGKVPLALGFSQFQNYVRLPESCFHLEENLRASRQCVNRVVNNHGVVHAVIAVPLLVATIQNRGGLNPLPKEN
jgi:chemotaxis signal transduction protein